MELLDRYVQAVKFWLPRAQQDDIATELSEDIQSQIEERETALGRKLNDGEIESILKQRGRPLVVACGYLPQRHLIGPVLFPVYLFVLKIVMLCYLAPWLLVWISLMSFSPGYRATHSASGDLFGAWGSLWLTAFIVISMVTMGFAVLEQVQSKSRFLEDWEPRKLPQVRNVKQIPRTSAVIEMAANLVFITWWVSSMWSQTIFERSGVRIMLAPLWRVVFWAFLLLALANVALAAVNLFRPYWTPLRGWFRLVLDALGAATMCWLCKAHLLTAISAPHLSSPRATEIANAINTYMAKSFPFVVITFLLIIVLADVGRLIRLRESGFRRMLKNSTA